MFNQSKIKPNGWLAFEINVLRRLKFDVVIMPFAAQPTLGVHLKRWNVRVLANDIMQSAWTKSVATIQNNAETLSESDVNTILEDAYVPRYRLQNAALRRWFNETDSWWFDNVRRNIEKLPTQATRAMALHLGMNVGDYAASFTDETLELRQSFSKIYRRLWAAYSKPFDNSQDNLCLNKPANEFVAEAATAANLMFLRLPSVNYQNNFGGAARREEWIRGGDDFWTDLRVSSKGKFGVPVETKSQYLQLFEDILQAAHKVPNWAIAHVEDGFLTTQELVETIGRVRRVDTIYSKDFSELTGTKAVIITA